jgi:hypothetical protein
LERSNRWSVTAVALIAVSMGIPIASHADTFVIIQDNLTTSDLAAGAAVVHCGNRPLNASRRAPRAWRKPASIQT